MCTAVHVHGVPENDSFISLNPVICLFTFIEHDVSAAVFSSSSEFCLFYKEMTYFVIKSPKNASNVLKYFPIRPKLRRDDVGNDQAHTL